MSMHILSIRCSDCFVVFSVRKPNDSLLIPAIVAIVRCPICRPEALKDCCAACRLPFSLFPRSEGRGNIRSDMCFSCYVSLKRYNERMRATLHE
jgi:hypothetical protein